MARGLYSTIVLRSGWKENRTKVDLEALFISLGEARLIAAVLTPQHPIAPLAVMLATVYASESMSTPLDESQRNRLDEWIGMDQRAVLP